MAFPKGLCPATSTTENHVSMCMFIIIVSCCYVCTVYIHVELIFIALIVMSQGLAAYLILRTSIE